MAVKSFKSTKPKEKKVVDPVETTSEPTEDQKSRNKSESKAKSGWLINWRIPVLCIQNRWSFDLWKKYLVSNKVFHIYSDSFEQISIEEYETVESKKTTMTRR